jgi:hypothetical protein
VGISVQVKQGRKGWYVAADFGDGKPVVKGPMLEAEAKAMATELESEAAEASGVVVRDRSEDEERANRRAAMVFFAALGVLAGLLAFVVTWWIR